MKTVERIAVFIIKIATPSFLLVSILFPAASLAQSSNTELQVKGIAGTSSEDLFAFLTLTNFESRVGEVTSALRVGEKCGDVEIIAVNPARGSVSLRTVTGVFEVRVGHTVRIHHTPGANPTSRDKLYAKYGDYVPPGRFRSIQ